MTYIATSPAEINPRLAEDGFVVVDLLPPEAVDALRAAHERLAPSVRANFDSTVLSHDLGLRSAVDRLVRAVISTGVDTWLPSHRIAFCTFALKRAAGDGGTVPMHQDWSFVDETLHLSFGLWCPLTSVDAGNGCLQVVKGSHALPHPPRAACSPFFYPGIEERLRASSLTTVPMRAGQAMLFDNRLFHCSPPNRSGIDRLAATSVLVPHAARLRYYHQVDRQRPHLVEVFEVDETFYLSHVAPGRPAHATSLGLMDIRATSDARSQSSRS
jgi:ectoine hydroxylase-related dioxygenase (phytanoyl-CoA dioxygenase family)